MHFGATAFGEISIAAGLDPLSLKRGAIVAALSTVPRYQATVETLPKLQATVTTVTGK